MLSPGHYDARRRQLLSRLEQPALLFAGGERSRNFPAGYYPFRADSNFLYFFGDAEPQAAALFDPGDGSVTLFLRERTVDTATWEGAIPSFEEVQRATGVDRVLPVEKLAAKRPVSSVAVMDSHTRELARRITGLSLDPQDPEKVGDLGLVDVLAEMRMRKNDAEIGELRDAARVTRAAFTGAMAASRVGVSEQVLAADVGAAFARHGGTRAFPPILSVRGEVLHNPHHRGSLQDGDLVLLDGGAEVPSGYASDVTRVWPANGRFRPEQRAVYETVLAAVRAATDMCVAGTRFRDIHFRAAEVLAEGLVDLGLLKGTPAAAVERGAHAVFFPHGVGHLLGLDVHDLETFGDRILYPGRERSDDFGTRFLRIDLDLVPGTVVTIEPGIYFVPAILHGSEFRKRLGDVVDFERAEQFLGMNDGRGFGGVRLEDDVLVTEGDPDVLTAEIPIDVDAVEELVGSETVREVGVRA
jgi:Xaa-Pro aminopeptidase